MDGSRGRSGAAVRGGYGLGMGPLTWQEWVTLGVVLGMLGLLARGRYGPDIVLMGAVLTLLVAGVVSAPEAVRGFANPAVVTVAMLYVVATAMRETGAMQMVIGRLLGKPKTELGAQARLVLPVGCMSALVNNTPIVAMFLPVLSGVAKRSGLSASRLFMPLSFASILGGVCTLIGTSTTVVVAGLLIAGDVRDSDGDPVRIGMFTVSVVGIPILVVGVVYILLLGRKLLPARGDALGGPGVAKPYHTAMRVSDSAPIVGRTVEAAGLRHLPGLFLSRIERDNESVIAVGPEAEIRAGDVLVFVGRLESVVELQQAKGLLPVTDEQQEELGYRPDMRLIEAVLAPSSRLVGRTIREAGLRSRFNAVVVAVHRQGERLHGKLGDVRLRGGDTLLLEAPVRFAERYREASDFYLVSELPGAAGLRHEKAWIALAVLVGLVAALSFGVNPMTAAMAAAGAMIVTRCCSGAQARAGADLQVLVTIGAAFGVGLALANSGLAHRAALLLEDATGALGPVGTLAGVYAMTAVFTAVLTNNAAAVLMFPIAMDIAEGASIHPMPLAICVAIAASCEFSTPIGYQTNLMVMGPGGYKWLDYTKFGGPLTVLCGIVCVTMCALVWGVG